VYGDHQVILIICFIFMSDMKQIRTSQNDSETISSTFSLPLTAVGKLMNGNPLLQVFFAYKLATLKNKISVQQTNYYLLLTTIIRFKFTKFRSEHRVSIVVSSARSCSKSEIRKKTFYVQKMCRSKGGSDPSIYIYICL
jgi:hypothetical protein